MALLFIDSFDHYATADLPGKYSTASGATIVAAIGRRSSSGLRTNGSGQSVTKTLAPSGNVAVLGLAMKTANLSGAGNAGYVQILSGATVQLMFTVTSGGLWQVYRRDLPFGTLLGTSSGSPLVVNTYAFVEVKAAIHASAGTVDIRVNGTSVLSLTAQNTSQSGSAAWDGIALFGADVVDRDDLYVLDGSGAAPLNTFLGDCRVDPCYPTGAGATTGWTASAGANYTCVDETAPNGDTDYVAAVTAPLTDTYAVQDAPVVGGTIYGVQVNLSAKKTDTSACTLAPVIRHAGTDQVGTPVPPGTAYAYLLQAYGTNPGTGAAWTEAGFNAAEFGGKRVS